MPVTLGGGITIVTGTRSPPMRDERVASAAKHSAPSHCAYTAGSVMDGSYRSGNSGMVAKEQERAKTKRAASLRLAHDRREIADLLGATSVAEVRALAAGVAGRVHPRGPDRRLAGVGGMIGFPYPGGG